MKIQMKRGLGFVLGLCLMACGGDSGTGGDNPASLVLARHDRGTVTLQDLDVHLAETASQLEWQSELGDPERLERLVRRLAVRQIVAELAVEDGADQSPEMQARRRDVLRRAAARQALENAKIDLTITSADLLMYFEKQKDTLERPERRRVYHIFKRRQEGTSLGSIRTELEALRQRVLDGESFSRLALEHSDSETRHREGLLGLVPPGHFPEDFDAVVFQLPEGQPSEPVFTEDGGHLFWVSDILPERRPDFSEVSGELARQLAQQRRDDAYRSLAAAALEEQGEIFLDANDFARLLTAPTPPPLLFRVGDFEYRAADFARALQAFERQRRSLDTPQNLLQRTYHQEILLQEAQDLDALAPETLKEETADALVDIYLRRQFRDRVASEDEALQRHYERNIGRFTRPVQLDLTRLRIPLEVADSRMMGTLETSIDALNAGQMTLESFAAEHGGRIDRIQDATVALLRSQAPRVVRFAFALQPGEHSPPFSGPEHLFMLRLDQRSEAQAMPFDAIRDQVVEDSLQSRGAELYTDYSDRLLDEQGLVVDSETLQRGARLLARLP